MQVSAILRDSFRELRSRSLFWITIVLSAVVAIALFGLIRFDEDGWGMLWFATNESDILTSGSYAARELLSWLFGGAFVYWWLAWGTIILALLSTASIVPDFVASGSIDLAVSKPIGRMKLFIVKVLGALAFMLVQVTLGVLLAYFLMGLRFDTWFHSALWSIPLLTIQFLYLYAVMALVGVVTRSPLASLLIVLVFWSAISIVQFASNQMDTIVAQSQAQVDIQQERIETIRSTAAEEDRELSASEQRIINRSESSLSSGQGMIDTFEPWQWRVNTLTLFVPKTGDIQKIIADQVEAPTFNELLMILGGMDEQSVAMVSEMEDNMARRDMEQAGVEASRAVREVNMTTSLATSLTFTALVLMAAGWLFYRRDF